VAIQVCRNSGSRAVESPAGGLLRRSAPRDDVEGIAAITAAESDALHTL